MGPSNSNPWATSFLEGGSAFETRFVLYSLGYVLVGLVGNWCRDSYRAAVAANPKSPPDPRGLKSLIASRPTVIAATVHSVATSILAVGILALHRANANAGNDDPWAYGGVDLLDVWRTIGLPLSLSYFAVDCYFYCLPRKDGLIFVHHFIMIFCHYTVGSLPGATVAGAGDPEWATWLSVLGYTSEVSTAVMNYRWYLINTLEENWIGFGIVNVFTALSWAGRVCLFTYLLIVEILPRRWDYVEHGQLFAYGVMIFGHASIGLLSLHWCVVMCRGGLRSLFVFKKKDPRAIGSQEGFSFADEVAGKSDADGSPTKRKSIIAPLDESVEERAQAYKDGSIFSDEQVQRRQSKKKQ